MFLYEKIANASWDLFYVKVANAIGLFILISKIANASWDSVLYDDVAKAKRIDLRHYYYLNDTIDTFGIIVHLWLNKRLPTLVGIVLNGVWLKPKYNIKINWVLFFMMMWLKP